MADDAKADEMIEQLRDEFALRIRTALRELPAHEALQLADALCTAQLQVLAGMRVRYKAQPKADAEAVAEDWRRGLTVAEIARKHGISRAAAYRLHPVKRAELA